MPRAGLRGMNSQNAWPPIGFHVTYSDRWLTEGLFCSLNDAVLSTLWEVNEVSAVPGHPHDKIGVLLRLGLRRPEFLAVDHIELDVRNTPLVPDLEIIGKELAVITFQEFGHEPLVEQIRVHEGDLAY